MRLCNFLVGASVAGVLLTACTTDEITIPKSELYAREFIKKFGVIDPDRDFNAATRSGVTVITGRPTDVKVYADINGKRYIFAEGRKISGTTPLTFDVPKSVKEVIVSADGQKIKASLGSTVNVSAPHKNVSRNINGSEEDWTIEDELTWKIAPEKKYSTLAVLSYLGTYPENKNNIPNGLNSFYFIADGNPHTFYPFYWYTVAQHCLGIYVVDPNDDDKITLHDLYYSKSGELMYSNDYKPEIDVITHYAGTSRLVAMNKNNTLLPSFITYSGSGDTWTGWLTDLGINIYGENYAETQIREFGEDSPFTTEHGYISKISYIYYENSRIISFYETPLEDYDEVLNQGVNEGSWSKVGAQPAYTASADTYIKTRGITYTLPEGTKYGFYIKIRNQAINPDTDEVEIISNDYSAIVFSNADRNKKPYYDESGVIRNEKIYTKGWPEEYYTKDGYEPGPSDGYVYASWGKGQMDGIQYSMFGFEDWPVGENNNTACDMNDIMFLFAAGEEPTRIVDTKEPEPEVYKWLIAAEDLAGTYDWDFNDAVFAVSATTIVDGEDNNATKTEITVEPLAAGGTLPIYVMFNGDISVENGEGTLENLGLGHYTIGQELHRWLGGYYRTPINVKDAVATATGKPLKFIVDGEWSLTDNYQNNPSWAQQDVKGMGGFYVLVNPGNTLPAKELEITAFDAKLLDDENHFHQVTPPSSFNKQDQVVVAPEMLCLETHWCWPQEEQPIHEVYHDFEAWLKGAPTDWYSPGGAWDPSRVVTRK